MVNTSRTISCWYRVTPNRLLLVLLAVEVSLGVSDRYCWFSLDRYDNRALLIALGAAGATIALLTLWSLTSLVFRWRFQFNLRSLLLIVMAVGVPCGWLFREVEREQNQGRVAERIREMGGKAFVQPTLLGRLLRDDSLTYVFYIDLSGTGANDASLAAIAQLRELLILYLSNTRITDAGLVHLRGLAYLQDLDLGGTKITDAGLVHLRNLKRLDRLGLGYTEITDAGLAHLRGLAALSDLGVYCTKVTVEGRKHLEQDMPSVQTWGDE
jgi:hypothetical protein